MGHLWGAPTTSRRSSDSSSTHHRHHQVSSPNPVAVDRHCLQAVADRRPTAELCSCRSSLLLAAGVRPARLHPPCLASYRCFPQCCGCSSTSPLHPWRKTILRAGHRTSPCSRSETDCFLLDGCPLPSVRSAAPARVWRNRASVTQGLRPERHRSARLLPAIKRNFPSPDKGCCTFITGQQNKHIPNGTRTAQIRAHTAPSNRYTNQSPRSPPITNTHAPKSAAAVVRSQITASLHPNAMRSALAFVALLARARTRSRVAIAPVMRADSPSRAKCAMFRTLKAT